MRRIIVLLFIILVSALSGTAQTTSITGAVVDSNNNAYAFGTLSAYITLNSGQQLPPGAKFSTGPVPTNSLGSFTIVVFSPASYVFTVCAPAVNIGPSSSSTPVCFTSTPIAISGATQDIGAFLSGQAPKLGPGLGGGITQVGTPPVGSCTAGGIRILTTNGAIYTCNSSLSWQVYVPALAPTQVVPPATTTTFDGNNGNTFKTTLAASPVVTNSTLINAKDGQVYVIVLCQDSVGGRAWVWGTIFVNPTPAPTIANDCRAALFTFDINSNTAIGPPSSAASSPAFSVPVTVSISTASQVPLTTTAASGQTGDMAQFRNNAGTVLTRVDSTGNLVTQNATANQVSTTAAGPLIVQSTGALAAATSGVANQRWYADNNGRWSLSTNGAAYIAYMQSGIDTDTFKQIRQATACTTGTTQFSTCTFTWTFTTAFADANYTGPFCFFDATTGGSATYVGSSSKLAASVVATMMKLDAAATAVTGTLNCVAFHNQ